MIDTEHIAETIFLSTCCSGKTILSIQIDDDDDEEEFKESIGADQVNIVELLLLFVRNAW